MKKQYEITEFSTLSDLFDKLDNVEMVSDVDTLCWFALPIDKSIGDILTNKFIRKALSSSVESNYFDKIEQFFNQSSKVAPAAFSELFGILNRCSESPGLCLVLPLVVSGKVKEVNVLVMGVDKFFYIVINPMVVALLDEKEIDFLIGYQCGHILENNLTIFTVYSLLNNYKNKNRIFGGMVSGMIAIPISYWYQCSEITSDRGGAICCGDLDVTQRMILCSEYGYNAIKNDGCKDMIAQCKSEQRDVIKNLFEHDAVHSIASKRLLAIGMLNKAIESKNAQEINEKIINYVK